MVQCGQEPVYVLHGIRRQHRVTAESGADEVACGDYKRTIGEAENEISDQ